MQMPRVINIYGSWNLTISRQTRLSSTTVRVIIIINTRFNVAKFEATTSNNYVSFFFIDSKSTRSPFFFLVEEESGRYRAFSPIPEWRVSSSPFNPHASHVHVDVDGWRTLSSVKRMPGGLSNGVSCRLEWIRCISFTFTSERGSALGITPMPSILFPLCSPSLSCKSRVNISASLKFPSTSFESFRIYACFGSLPSRNAYVRSIQRCIIV